MDRKLRKQMERFSEMPGQMMLDLGGRREWIKDRDKVSKASFILYNSYRAMVNKTFR